MSPGHMRGRDVPNPTHDGLTEIGFEVDLTHPAMRRQMDGSVGGGPGTRHRLDRLPRLVRVENCLHGLAERVPIRFVIVQGLT